MKKGATTLARRRAAARRKPATRSDSPHPSRTARITPEELAVLQDQLRELTETVDALRTGAVDAVVVSGPHGNQIYSLTGAEHPYRIYVESMQEGAVTVSADGVILYTNQRFAGMLHLPLERVIGSNIRDYVGEVAWREISSVFHRGDKPVKHAGTLRRADTQPLPVHLTVSGLQIDNQDMLCLVVTDLTEQYETTELRVAKEIAEKANRAKDDFLAALSHELRTPLTPALVSATNVERDASLPAHLRDELMVVRRNVELEARLIDDLLDLTRIARGKLELHLSRLDVHTVLDEALTICQPDIAAKRLIVSVNKEATRTGTEGDAIRIQQVLWNLLRNAVKFTPEGGRITLRTHNPQAGRLAIAVSDSGIGFDESTAAKMFNAFEQGGRQITRQFGGLGLGLAISRSIAEAHGGSIRAVSEGPGNGASFTLELPLKANVPAETSAAQSPESTGLSASGLRILLVEDHKDTRLVLERVLRRQKHHVHAAADARSALDIAERHPLDIVISDLGLPDQSGLELMRQLRDRFGLRGIAVSGYGMEEDVAKSHSAGFVHHVTKPICVERLRQLIGTVEIRPIT